MADTIKKIIEIEFSVNNGPVQKFSGDVEQVTKKVEDLEKAITSIPDATLNLTVDGVETSVEDIKKLGASTKEVGENTKTLKQQYKEAVVELQRFTKGTAEYETAKQRAGALKDELEDLNRTISANKSGADAILGSLRGVAGGFAIAQGAAGLFGGENEKVQQALLKVQSALALVQGLEALKDSFASFQAVGSGIGEVGNKVGTAIASLFGFGSASAVAAAETELLAAANAQNAVATEAAVIAETEAAATATILGTANAVAAVETEALGIAGATAGAEVAVGMEAASVGTYGFAAALTATGIGAIIVAIGVAIAVVAAYWDDIKAAVSGVSQEQRNSLKSAQDNTVAQQKSLDTLNASDEVLKSQGKTEDEILQIKIKQTKEVLVARKQELEKSQELRKSQIAAAERNQKILKGILDYLTIPLRLLLVTIDAVGSALGQDFGLEAGLDKFTKGAASLVFDPEEMKKQGEKEDEEFKKATLALENTQAGYENKRKDNKKKANADATKKAEDYNKKLQELQKKHNEEMSRLQKEQNDNVNKLRELDAEDNVKKEEAKLDAVLSNIKSARQKELDALKERQDEITKLREKNAKDPRIKKLEEEVGKEQLLINKKYNDLTTIAWKEYGDNINNIIKDNAQKRAKLQSELRGQTYKEALAELNVANNAEFDALKKAGINEEEILKLFAQRRKKLELEFEANKKTTETDKQYFQDLAALYNDDTLSYEKRTKLIQKLDEKRIADTLANEKKANEDKMKEYDKGSKEYADLAKRNEEIDAISAKNKVDIANKETDEKIAAAERFADKALEYAQMLADLAQALLEVQTKRINEEYDKRLSDQTKSNDDRLNNLELSDAQRLEVERQNALEITAIEEEKAAKLKEVQKKQADIDFVITIANIAASTALAIAKAVAATPLTGGLPFSAIAAAIGAVQVATAIAQRQAVQGLAMGGMIYGPGTSTSDDIPIMASNGEAVINAAAVQRFAPVLSAINESTGGAPIRPRFAAGGVVTANPGAVSVTNIGELAAITGNSAVRAYILQSDVTSETVRNNRILRDSRTR
jgi:hypothetical protein